MNNATNLISVKFVNVDGKLRYIIHNIIETDSVSFTCLFSS